MYAKPVMTSWALDAPATGTFDNGQSFEHELGCPVQGSYQDCTCYVSRIRLVKTPVGRIIATTEPDLLPHLEYRRAFAEQMRLRAEKVQRENNVLWIGIIITSVSGLIALSGLAFELGLV